MIKRNRGRGWYMGGPIGIGDDPDAVAVALLGIVKDEYRITGAARLAGGPVPGDGATRGAGIASECRAVITIGTPKSVLIRVLRRSAVARLLVCS